MRVSDNFFHRHIAVCVVMCMLVPFAKAATARQLQTSSGGQTDGTYSTSAQSENYDRATSKPIAASEASLADPNAPLVRATDQDSPSGTAQSASEPQQNGTSNPVGTAAAPYEKTTGIAASSPAGAAIAPAKQKRTRSILIKVGVILGAAVAIGTVAALSKSTSSRPN